MKFLPRLPTSTLKVKHPLLPTPVKKMGKKCFGANVSPWVCFSDTVISWSHVLLDFPGLTFCRLSATAALDAPPASSSPNHIHI